MAPIKMSEVNEVVRIFNIRYGVNFSLGAYKSAITKAEKQAKSLNSEVDYVKIQCDVYKETIKNLYRTMALNACKKLDNKFTVDNTDVLVEDVNLRSSSSALHRNEPILAGNYSFDGESIMIDDERDEIPFNNNQNEPTQIRERAARYIVDIDDTIFDEKLLKEFNDAIFKAYMQTQEGKSLLIANPYEQLPENEIMQAVYDGVKDLKTNPVSLYEELYTSGNLRIRDMRSYVQSITKGVYSEESMAKGLQLVQALKNVNETRSFWWKLFHPFRNNAEQRDAAKMEAMMTSHIIRTNPIAPEDADLGRSQEDHNAEVVNRFKDAAKTYSPLKDAFEDIEETLQQFEEDNKEENELENPSNKNEEEIEENIIVNQQPSKPEFFYDDVIEDLNKNKDQVESKIRDIWEKALPNEKYKKLAETGEKLYKNIIKTLNDTAGNLAQVSNLIYNIALNDLVHSNAEKYRNNEGFFSPTEDIIIKAQEMTDQVLESTILKDCPNTFKEYKGYSINNNIHDIKQSYDNDIQDYENAAKEYNAKHKNTEKQVESNQKESIIVDLNEGKEVKLSNQIKEGSVLNNNLDKSHH